MNQEEFELFNKMIRLARYNAVSLTIEYYECGQEWEIFTNSPAKSERNATGDRTSLKEVIELTIKHIKSISAAATQ